MTDIVVKVGLDTSQFEAGLARMRQSFNQAMSNAVWQAPMEQLKRGFGDMVTEVQRGLGRLSDAQKAAEAAAVAAGASISKVGLAGVNLGISMARTGDALTAHAGRVRAWSNEMLQTVPGIQALDKVVQQFGLSIQDLGKVAGQAAVFGAMAIGTKEALEFEKALTLVRRQVNLVGDETQTAAQQFAALTEEIIDISAQTGVAAESIAEIAAEAGKLGLQSTQDISQFTETIVKLSKVSGLSAKELTAAFGQLSVQMGDSLQNAEAWGSALVELANNSNASEAKILSMAQSIAGVGRALGLTTDQVLGLATAMASVGAQPMAMNRMLFEMNRAVREASGNLELFAKVAGLSMKEFGALFRQDASRAIVAFFEGLGQHAEEASIILDKLGLDGQQTAKSMLLLAQSVGVTDKSISLLAETFGLAAKGMQENTALQKEYNIAVDNTLDQLSKLANLIKIDLMIAFTGAVPLIRAFVDGLIAIAEFAREHPMLLKIAGAVTMVAAGFVALKVALIGLGLIWAGIVGGIGALMTALGGLVTAAGAVVAVLGGPLTLALAAAGAAVFAFVKYTDMGRRAWEAFKGAIGFGPTEQAALKDTEDGAREMSDLWVKTSQETGRALEAQAAKTAQTTRQIAGSLKELSQEEAKAIERTMSMRQASFENAMALTQQTRENAKALGAMTEREVLDQLVNEAEARKRLADLQYADAVRLADRDYKTKADAIQKAQEAQTKATNELIRARQDQSVKTQLLDRQDAEAFGRSFLDQIKLVEDARQKIGDIGQRLDRQIRDVGLTETQRTLQGFQDSYVDTLKEIEEEKKHLTVGSEGYTAALQRESQAQDLLNKRTQEFATRAAVESMRTLNALADSLGKTEEEAALAAEAWLRFGKAFTSLTDEEKRFVTASATTTETVRKQKEAVEALTLARQLDLAAMRLGMAMSSQEIAMMAVTIKGIEKQQADMDLLIQSYETLNNARQKSDLQYAQLLQGRAQHERNYYQFSVGSLLRYAAQQDTIWQGIDRMVQTTMGNIQRSLSDTFFNLFTGQSMKLKDVWKDLLNSMRRELANFMASAAVKAFINFAGNLLNGQSAGTAASNALGSLLGGSSGAGAGGGGGAMGSGASAGATVVGGIINRIFGGGTSSSGVLPAVGTSISSDGSGLGFGGGLGTGSFYTAIPSSSYAGPAISPFGDAYVPEFTPDYGSYAFARGGRVPGAGHGDTVPAMLEPGEFVVRRDVAQRMGSTLDALNGGGRPTSGGGYLNFATGGTVPVIEARSVTTDALLAAILATLNRQTQATQVIAQNTTQTAAAVTTAQQRTGTSTISAIAGGGGGPEEPGFIQQILNSGYVQSGASLLGSGARGIGGNAVPVGHGLVGLAGLASLAQGLQSGNPYMAAHGGLTTASSLAMVLSNPAVARALGLSPGFATGAGVAGQGLSAATGLLGVAQGIQQGNYIGAAAGGAQTAASVAQILSNPAVAQALGYSTSTAAALGAVGGGLGVVAGGLNIYQGIQSGQTSQVAGGAFNTALGAYQVASYFTGTSAGAGASGATASAAGTGTTAASGAISATAATVGYVAALAAVAYGIWSHQEAVQAEQRRHGIIEGIKIRQAYNAAVPKVVAAMQAVESLASLAGQPASVQMQRLQEVENALKAGWAGLADVSHFISTKGVGNAKAISAIGRADTTQAEQLAAMATPVIVAGLARVTDARAILSGGLTDAPVDIATLLTVAAGSSGVGPGFSGALYGGQFASQLGAAAPGTFSQTMASLLSMNNPAFGTSIFGKTLAAVPGFVGTPEQTAAALTTGSARNQARIQQLIAGAMRDPRALTSTSLAGAYNPGGGIQWSAGGLPYFAGGGNKGLLIDALGGSGSHELLNPYNTYAMPVESIIPQLEQARLAHEQYFGPNYGMAEGGLVLPRHLRQRFGRDSVPAMLEAGEFVVPRALAAGHLGRLRSFMRTGRWETTEQEARYVMPSTQASYGLVTAATRAARGGAFDRGGMNIAITINGDVTDPRRTAETLSTAMRDELRRSDSRFSRAGNKSQG